MANKWLTTAALAAGLVAVPSVASADTQWRLFGGASSADDLSGSYYGYDIEVSSETGFVVGAALGVNAGNWTAEVELSHRSIEADEATVSYYGYAFTGPLDGELTSTALMGNAWYNFPSTGNFGFYAGGGAGIADTEVGLSNAYYDYSDDGTNFAWQLGAGVNMKTDTGFSYGIGYRYFNVDNIGDTGLDLSAHEVVFEFRF